jgi:hypothetical protein
MNADDEAARKSRNRTDAAGPAWVEAAEAARQAASRRLRILGGEHGLAETALSGCSSLGAAPRSVDDEPAALVYDSNLDAELLASVRTGGQALRQLTFEAGDVVLELEISSTGHLTGQVVPPQTALVELRHRGGTTPVETDELGYFRVPAKPDGPVSVRWFPERSPDRPVATSWITL